MSLVNLVVEHFPDVQAVYLFGSCASGEERAESDLDLALLLPSGRARELGVSGLMELRFALERDVGRDVDLINLRRVPTVLQNEVIVGGRRLYCADQRAVEEFEMLVLSYYQKLNQERAAILDSIAREGRVLAT